LAHDFALVCGDPEPRAVICPVTIVRFVHYILHAGLEQDLSVCGAHKFAL